MAIQRFSNEEIEQLPKETYWGVDVYQWEGFWYSLDVLQTMLTLKSHFKARSDDVVVTSSMKTGTTWLKALCVYIMSDQSKDFVHDELLVKNPHEVVKPLEYIYAEDFDFSGLKSPRIFGTHLPYSALPDSIKNSDCKIVYITRNPMDTLVSLWHFLNNVILANQDPYPFEKAFDEFCKGVHFFGPFLDHVLQYWLESLKMPNKILFLKYEDLKRDPKGEVKRLASFLGRPFDNEHEVDKVIWKSSLERLKNLEVNKNGVLYNSEIKIPNSSFFRLGIVGIGRTMFTTEMKERLDEVTRIKLESSDLDFET